MRILPLAGLAAVLILVLAGSPAAAAPAPAPAPPAGPQACGPAPGGSTCGGAAGVASQASQGGVDVGVGNPINLINGNKYQREVDLSPLPGVLGLEIVRHYNSAYSKPGMAPGSFGRGWKLSYETDLYTIGKTIQIIQADGTRVMFSRDPNDPSLCSTTNPANGTLRIRKSADGEAYAWTWTSGRVLDFDRRGKLVQIVAPGGQFLSLQHDAAGMLLQVVDPQGRKLVLHATALGPAERTGRRAVAWIDSPAGRFQYGYGTARAAGDRRLVDASRANLVSVDFPDQASGRRYHYEDVQHPAYLTGISERGGAADKPALFRIGTYLYDMQGRAILSVHGEPARLQTDQIGKTLRPVRLVEGTGVGQVTLDFSMPGKTVVANSLGQSTTYRHAIIGGEYRILEAIGPGCQQCGPTNIRYGWHPSGQLASITGLTESGATLPVAAIFFEYDARGRQTASWRQAYGPEGRPSGTRQLVQRQEFSSDHDEPVLIARPSVVPGQERQTRIVYGQSAVMRRLPTRITETGFIPAIDGKTAAHAIERSIDYRYDDFGARIATDGPLPNAPANAGPGNSDITLTDFDPATHLMRRIVAPGARVTEIIKRDVALRPSVIRTSDGVTAQTTRIARNWRGQPVEIVVDAEADAITSTAAATDEFTRTSGGKLTRSMRYRYDAAGRLLAITMPTGLEVHMRYDRLGRMTHRVLPDGSTTVVLQDTESRDQRIDTFSDVDDATALAVRTDMLRYDPLGHVQRVDDGSGVGRQYEFDPRGRRTTSTDALGVASRLVYDDKDALISQVDAFATPDQAITRLQNDHLGNAIAITDPNGVTTRQWHDDFGRKVAEISPDRGITLYRHDVAGHQIARIDESGVTTRSAYDFAGRIVTSGIDNQTALVRYRYLGARLQDVTTLSIGTAAAPGHITQQTRYRYDALGQQVLQREWLERADGATTVATVDSRQPQGLQFDTANIYDDAGRLVQQVLPDGHRLRYDFAPANIARAAGRPGQLLAIRFDDQIVVDRISQSVAGGLTGYVSGSGIRQELRMDASGRIRAMHAFIPASGATAGISGSRWPTAAAWFADRSFQREQSLYRQENHYDAAGRLVDIARHKLVAPTGSAASRRNEHYGYDRLDRLTTVTVDGKATNQFSYDKGGNRIGETDASGARHYRYGAGTNRLVAITADSPVPEQAPGATRMQKTSLLDPLSQRLDSVESAWLYKATGVPLAQIVFGGMRMQQSGDLARSTQRIVYDSANRPVEIYNDSNQIIARYTYNRVGERVAKTIYPVHDIPDETVSTKSVGKTSTIGLTQYRLFRDQRLAAEANADGRLTHHYVYLYGKPIAKVVIGTQFRFGHGLWLQLDRLRMTLLGGEPNRDTANAKIFAIHTDHLGTPQMVTDQSRKVVWLADISAFGQATIVHAADGNGKEEKFRLDLRLPGQVFDEETGLNYNYFRDYDSRTGRYLTPDPVGTAGGLQPYHYGSSNPLLQTDPLGLYETDVHYYMTFFLARMAGIGYQEARTIALAAQYIDDNPDTWPVDDDHFLDNVDPLNNGPALNRLASYHFTTTSPSWYNPFDYDPPPTVLERIQEKISGNASETYTARRYKDPVNPQLTRLNATVSRAPTPCARAQFFGEYLHAFEDTFGHRNKLNVPININQGLGHGAYGHSPDKTYNHSVTLLDLARRPLGLEMLLAPELGDWFQNEARSYEMEYEVFTKLRQLHDTTGANELTKKPIRFRDISDFLESWNKIQNTPDKIADLAFKMDEFGLGLLPDYSKACAAEKRRAYLGGLDPSQYAGSILPTGNKTTTAVSKVCNP